MDSRSFYNEILTEHNARPYHKHELEDADLVLEGVNPNCGDDIFLKYNYNNRQMLILLLHSVEPFLHLSLF